MYSSVHLPASDCPWLAIGLIADFNPMMSGHLLIADDRDRSLVVFALKVYLLPVRSYHDQVLQLIILLLTRDPK